MSQYRKPVLPKPAGVMRQKSNVIPDWSKYIYLLIRTLLLLIILAGLSIGIGLYSYRIYESNPGSIIDAMDAIVKQPAPPSRTIQITAISAIIFATIFYGEYVKSQVWQTAERPTGFSKFLAGAVLIVWIDIHLLRIDFYLLTYRGTYPDDLLSIVIGQVISILSLMLLMPVFMKLMVLGSLSSHSQLVNEKVKKALNYLWYGVVSFLAIVLITYLSSVEFQERTYYSFSSLDLPIVRGGIFLTAFGFMIFFQRPPKSLGLSQSFTFMRLILGILSVLGVGFFYSRAPNPEIFLVYVMVALLLSWLSQPVIKLFT